MVCNFVQIRAQHTQKRNKQSSGLDGFDGGVITETIGSQLDHENANDVDEKDEIDAHGTDHGKTDDENGTRSTIAFPARFVRDNGIEFEHQAPRADAHGRQAPADGIVENGEDARVLVEWCVQSPMEDETFHKHPVHCRHRGVNIQHFQCFAKRIILHKSGEKRSNTQSRAYHASKIQLVDANQGIHENVETTIHQQSEAKILVNSNAKTLQWSARFNHLDSKVGRAWLT